MKQDFETKLARKIVWRTFFLKKPIKTVTTYNNVYAKFREFQIVGPNLAKRKNDKIFTK